MVISCDLYEMTTSVRLCLSYDPLKLDFIAFQMDNVSEENALLTRTLSVMLRVRASVITRVVIRFL